MNLEQLELFIDFAQRIWLTAYQLIEKKIDEFKMGSLNYSQIKMLVAMPEYILKGLEVSFEFEV